ncbi:MAG TPA: AAA family ATPase [Pirellulales bacterium]|nr:AAA family ATPase [Pirellulales bacterium]
MRIDRLRFSAFGPFTGREIDLSAGNQGLHVIYGPNEAGKSSALRALRHLLYGIPPRTPDNFVHPYEQMRIGGILQAADGTALEVVRRKGQRHTLRGADDDVPLDDDLLTRFLGGIDQSVFDTMFGIDHKTLVAGGEAIVKGSGRVGELLFVAGAGLAQLNTLQKQLQDEMSNLFKPNAQVPRINRSLRELREARDDLKASILPVAEWQKHDGALRESESRLTKLNDHLREKQADCNRLMRINQALPTLGRWKSATMALVPLSDARILADDFSRRRTDAMARLQSAKQKEQEAVERREQLVRDLEPLVVSDILLNDADSIEQLRERLGSHRKAGLDRPGLATAHQGAEDGAREILRTLGRPTKLDGVESLRLSRDRTLRVQNLANRQAGLVQSLDRALEDCSGLRGLIEQIKRAVATAAAPADPTKLRTAVEYIQSQGDLQQQKVVLEAEIETLAQDAEVRLRQLRLWSGTLEELERLAVPDEETIDRFEHDLRDSTAQLDALDRRRTEADGDRQALIERLEQLEATREILTLESLNSARRQREEGWQLVLEVWRDGKPDSARVEGFVRHFASANELTEAYDRSVHAADEVADRLRQDAELVGTKSKLLADEQQTSDRLSKFDAEIADRKAEHAGLLEDWKNNWTKVPIAVLTPREMRAWRNKQQALVGTAALLRAKRLEADRIWGRIEVARRELADELQRLDDVEASADHSLPVLLGRSKHRVEMLQDLATKRNNLSEELNRANVQLVGTEDRLAKAERQLNHWKTDWTAAMDELGLEHNATAEQANSVIEGLTQLFQKLHDARQLALRIDGIDEDARQFAEDVAGVLERLAPDLANRPIAEAVTDLNFRLTECRKAQSRCESLERKRQDEDKKCKQARKLIEDAELELANLCQEAGCQGPDELAGAENRSSQRRDWTRKMQELEAQLSLWCGGRPLPDFAAEAEAEPADILVPRIDDLTREVDELASQRESVLQTIGSERNELARMTGSGNAAAKADECESLLARLEADVRQLAVLRMAAAVLRAAIERYREENQGPVLERASRLFALLTLGSFTGLRTDFDEDGQLILLGVRADGKTVRVAGMSDGTADQLYLALRLANLEHWLTAHDPIPFVVDDVLLNFDDDRTAAAMRCLAELSHNMQVVLFTHHRHVVEVGRRELAHELFIHEL